MSSQTSNFFRFLLFALVFVSVFAESAIPEESPKPFSVIPYHAVGMFVIWTFLVELPILAIKKFKSATVHLALFALLDITTLGSVGFATYQKLEKIQTWGFKTPQGMAHCILGFAVPVLIVLQHILGFLTLNKSATARPIHKKLGMFLYYFTKLSVLSGTYMFDQTLFLVAVGWFSLVVLLRILFSGKKNKKE